MCRLYYAVLLAILFYVQKIHCPGRMQNQNINKSVAKMKLKKKKKKKIKNKIAFFQHSYFAIDNIFHVDVTRIFVGLDDYVIHDLRVTKKKKRYVEGGSQYYRVLNTL